MDKNMTEVLENFPEEDKLRLSSIINNLQSRDSLRVYRSMADRCFTDCVDAFWSKKLSKQEDSCVRGCANKFLKVSMLVNIKLEELTSPASKQN